MRNPELDEIRALLRSQALTQAEPAPGNLLRGVTSLWRRSAAQTAFRPLSLSPVSPGLRHADEGAASEPPAVTLTAEDHIPLTFLAPRRERFGLADEGARPAWTETAAEPQPLVLEPPQETPDDIEPRRAPELAEPDGASVGAEHIGELHDLLSARMPRLLDTIDLGAKREGAPTDSPEAAAARAEAAEAAAAWAAAGAELQARARDADPLPGPRLKLIALEADLTARHADAAEKLSTVRGRRRRRASMAA